MAQFERQLKLTQNGCQALRLIDRLTEARAAEELAGIGLEGCERTEGKLRSRFLRASQGRTGEVYRQAEALLMQHRGAETDVRRWRIEFQRHHGERERLEAELGVLVRYV